MASLDVERIISEINALSESEKQGLAEKVLPFLLITRTGIRQIDKSLAFLSDEELDGLIEYLKPIASHQRSTMHGERVVLSS